MLVRSINSLYSSLGRLDAELALRLAEWLALHISHFGYNLEPFEQMWAPCLSPAPIDGALHPAGRAGATAHDAFLSYLLDKAVRLAYLERVRKELPASFVSHLPPKPKGSAAWAPLGEGAATEPGSMAAKSAALLNRLRTKADQVEPTLRAAPRRRPAVSAHLPSNTHARIRSSHRPFPHPLGPWRTVVPHLSLLWLYCRLAGDVSLLSDGIVPHSL